MPNIEFFVVVPIYKAEKFIAKCIESIVKQTYSDYRLILVDDGSPDSSGSICDAYSLKYGWITVIHQPNQGPCIARANGMRRAVQMADGKTESSFCLFVDADDTLKPDAMQIIAMGLEQHQCDMLMFGFEKLSNGKSIYTTSKHDVKTQIIDDKEQLFSIVGNDKTFNSLCRKAVRIDLISKCAIRDDLSIKMGEDMVQSLEWYLHCQRIVILPDVLYEYQEISNSLTHTVSLQLVLDDLTATQLADEFLQKHQLLGDGGLERYRECAIQGVVNHLRSIGYYLGTNQEKRDSFRKIRQHPFVQQYLNADRAKKYGWIMILFYRKLYGLLAWLFSMRIRLAKR